jgi:hypothetical protein
MQKPETKERHERLIELWNNGTPVDQIAAELGYKNNQTVWATATNLGLKRRFFRDQRYRDARGRRVHA